MARGMAVIAALALAHPPDAWAETPLTVTIAVGDDYGPWVDRTLPHGGFVLGLIERAVGRVGGMSLETVWTPWNRALELARRGDADMTAPWIWTPARDRDFLLTRPIVSLDVYVYFRAGDSVETPADMRGKSLCLPLGYATYGAVEALIAAGELTRESPASMTACFRMLNARRVDFAVVAETEAPVAIREAGLAADRFGRSGAPLESQALRVLVSRASPNAKAILEGLDAAFAAMEADGATQALRALYP